MAQWGHAATKCCAMEMKKCYVTDQPLATALNNLAGVRVKFRADETYTAGNDVTTSAWKLHWF